VLKNLDNKCHYPTSALWVVPTTLSTTLTAQTSTFDPTHIVRFDSTSTNDKDKCRLGDTIKIHRIRMQGQVSDVGATINSARIMVVRWARNDFTDMDLNSILQDNAASGAVHSYTDHNCPYQILMDKKIKLGSTAGMQPLQYWSFDRKFKNPLTVAYDPSVDTADYSSIQKGLIRVYACCNTGTTCSLRYTWQVYFTDA